MVYMAKHNPKNLELRSRIASMAFVPDDFVDRILAQIPDLNDAAGIRKIRRVRRMLDTDEAITGALERSYLDCLNLVMAKKKTADSFINLSSEV
jgi:hypothetical protein